MAHKTGAGSTKNGRDSKSKRLGLKCTNNQLVNSGMILVRQRGIKIKPGLNIGCGKDFTLYSLIKGTVIFSKSNTINVF